VSSAPNPEVGVMRYFVIPLVGLSIGATIFLLLFKWEKSDDLAARCEMLLQGKEKKFLLGLTFIFLLLHLALSLSSYFTHHLGFFDFGVYDAKIWQISVAPNLEEKLKIASTGHLQPILILYSLGYSLVDFPGILLILQALATLSGVIPLYLLCKRKTDNSLIIVGLTLLYLLYPPLAFNSIVDFHPDHLYIPILLWAFYFAEENKYITLLPFLLLGCLIKEPYVLGAAFFGIYLLWRHKSLVFGLCILSFCLVLFYEVTFHVLPQTTFPQSEKTILQGSDFSYLGSSPLSILSNTMLHPLSFLKRILQVPKLRFPFFVLYPFIFLPLLRIKEFVPAFPFLLIPLLSTNLHHQNVASQYTAGIIPPLFVGLILLFVWVKDRFGQRIVFALLTLMVVLSLSLNLAHSPLPFSVNFWSKSWSFGRWHYSNYFKREHEKQLEKAIDLIPKDARLKVVIHSGIYHKRLFHRFDFDCFPKGLENADYLILDNTRGYLFCDQRVSETEYLDKVNQIKQNPRFNRIFDRSGILVFKRKPISNTARLLIPPSNSYVGVRALLFHPQTLQSDFFQRDHQ